MIKHPERFRQAHPAGFDGVFDWDWLKGCFGNTNISPMDIDACVERGNQFLMFETKDRGVMIPDGQMRTLRALRRVGCVTIVFIVGKAAPESAVAWYPGKAALDPDVDVEFMPDLPAIRSFVCRWFSWASNPLGTFERQK